jgi:alcohol dehydrogenase class IV
VILDLIGDMVRNAGVASLPALKRAAGAVTPFIPVPTPVLLVGPGAAAKLGQAIADFGHRRLLVVTDASIVNLGLLSPLADTLAAAGVQTTVFDAVTADAPIAIVEQGAARFASAHCDAVLAVGGGSVMDAAKVIALAAANKKPPRALAGYFRAWKSPAPIYAVPTTAGTGSEVTVAALISDPELGKKYMVLDTRIVPEMAALDPTLMVGLPDAVTAATGMDALTHAVEATLSGWATPATDRLALAAVAMIFVHLPHAFRHGSDLLAREKMALASTYAGLAFTRANVGNVHAIAHQLGGKYHTPHGLANAIMLPHVLRFSARATIGKLATLALRSKVGQMGETREDLARKFLDAVDELSRTVGIPTTLDVLREADIPALAKAACREADTNYPVPRVMLQADCEALLRKVLPERAAAAATKATRPVPRTTTARTTRAKKAAPGRPAAVRSRRPAKARSALRAPA